MDSLEATYRAYLDCLNAQDWEALPRYVADGVGRNGARLGVTGYRAMLEQDFRDIPDFAFKIELLVVDPPYVAARLRFDCSPAGVFLGLPVNGRHVSFSENVFYQFLEGKIVEVWSVIDKTAIEAQLALSSATAVPLVEFLDGLALDGLDLTRDPSPGRDPAL